MCIGVPGQVLAVGEDIHQLAQVEVCGIKRKNSSRILWL